MLKERIAEQLARYSEGKDLFLVDVKATPQDKIMVFIDGMKNVTIETCIAVSRMLEEFLETEKLVRENYVLEVSSPGMGQPFRVRQQYEKSVGRMLEVLLNDGVKYKGALGEVKEDEIVLRVEKKVKKKVVEVEDVAIPFDQIKATKQLITFK